MITPSVAQALNFLVKSYGNVRQASKSWQLNPQEVQDALKDVEKGTAEHYVLSLLADANPMPVVNKKVIPIAKDTGKQDEAIADKE